MVHLTTNTTKGDDAVACRNNETNTMGTMSLLHHGLFTKVINISWVRIASHITLLYQKKVREGVMLEGMFWEIKRKFSISKNSCSSVSKVFALVFIMKFHFSRHVFDETRATVK